MGRLFPRVLREQTQPQWRGSIIKTSLSPFLKTVESLKVIVCLVDHFREVIEGRLHVIIVHFPARPGHCRDNGVSGTPN
ncbi:hypothetical protein AAC387_Pa12g1875 [Persea americana]